MPLFLNSKKIIKVGIDGGDFIPFGVVKSGINRVVDSFLNELIIREDKNFIFNYYYFGNKTIKSSVNNVNFIRIPKRLYSTIFLPLFFKKNNNDIFLGFSSFFSPLLNYFALKKIIVLHDLGFLKYLNFYSNTNRLKQRLFYSVKNADKIIVFSKYVRNEIISRIPTVQRQKIKLIRPGLDHFKTLKPLINYQGKIPPKYFLFVGVIKPGKNIERLFRVFSLFLKRNSRKKYYLVLIGEKEKKYYHQLLNNSDYQKIKGRILFLENINDGILLSYYQKAEAIINLSYEEGFCFPVFEALFLGKKVIVNQLPIYLELKTYFKNLLIGKTDQEIVNLMEHKTLIHNTQSPINRVFTWKNFTDELLITIKDL